MKHILIVFLRRSFLSAISDWKEPTKIVLQIIECLFFFFILISLLLYVIAGSIQSTVLELSYSREMFTFLRSYFTLLQGTWLIQIGFILNPPTSHVRQWSDTDWDVTLSLSRVYVAYDGRVYVYMFCLHVHLVFISPTLSYLSLPRRVPVDLSRLDIEEVASERRWRWNTLCEFTESKRTWARYDDCFNNLQMTFCYMYWMESINTM